jgi:hypothetical protein
MRIITPPHDDNGVVDAGNQIGKEVGNDRPSPESNEKHTDQEEPEPRTDEEQAGDIQDIPMTSSRTEGWMVSRIGSIFPFAKLSEVEPISLQCAGTLPTFLTRMMTESDFPPLHFHPHRNESFGSLEELLGILDMALEIVNAN